MSTRGYKIINIRHKKNPTFNWTGEFSWLEELASSMEESIINFDKEILDDAFKNKEKQYNKHQLKILSEMIKDCDDDEWVEYYLY